MRGSHVAGPHVRIKRARRVITAGPFFNGGLQVRYLEPGSAKREENNGSFLIRIKDNSSFPVG